MNGNGCALGLPNLQGVYNAGDGSVPTVLLDSTRNGVVIRDAATPIGSSLWRVENNDGSIIHLDVKNGEIDIGSHDSVTSSPARIMRIRDAAGSIEFWGTDRTFTASPGGILVTGTPTHTHNYVNTSLGGFGLTHTVRLQQSAFAFNMALVFNNGMNIRNVSGVTANFGPNQSYIDQPNIAADNAVISMSMSRSFLSQPTFGGINGGTLNLTTWASLQCFGTLNAGCNVTNKYGLWYTDPLGAGGSLTNQYAVYIDNIIRGTNNYGIYSLMSSGANRYFIRHTGTALSTFAGDVHVNDGVSLVLGTEGGNRVELLRSAAGIFRMGGVGGTNNEALEWNFDSAPNVVSLGSPTGAGLLLTGGSGEVVLGGGGLLPDGTNNWAIAWNFAARATSLAGDYADVLFTPGANITVNHAIGQLAGVIFNEPGITIGTGSVVTAANVIIQTSVSQGTNRYGLLVTSNPSGGTLNYCARFQGAAGVRIDGLLDHIRSANTAANITAVYTFSATGASLGAVNLFGGDMVLAGTSNNPDETTGIKSFVESIAQYSTGTISDLAAFRSAFAFLNLGTACNITEAAHFRVKDNTWTGNVTVARLAGLWIPNLDGTNITNLNPIYQVGPNGINIFGSPSRFTNTLEAPGVIYEKGYDAVTGQTTTAATLEDIPGLTFNLTVPTGRTATIRALMTVESSAAGANVTGGWAISINSADKQEYARTMSTAMESGSVVAQGETTGLSAGTYAITGRHRRVSGASTVNTDVAELSAMLIIE